MPHTISLSFEDSHVLYHASAPVEPFRDEEAAGRFDPVVRLAQESQIMPDLAFASPDYEKGSLLWCDSASDALILRALHRAEGYSAELLWDNAGGDSSSIYVVLTSWDARANDPVLTDEPAVFELIFMGEGGESSIEVTLKAIQDKLKTVPGTEILGDPTVDDHSDHYHAVYMVKMTGEKFPPLLAELSNEIEGNYGYKYITAGD